MRQTNAAKTCARHTGIQQILALGALACALSGCIGYIAHDPETGTTVNIMGQKVVDPARKAGDGDASAD